MLLFSCLKSHVTNSAHQITNVYVWSRTFPSKDCSLYSAVKFLF